MAFVFRSWGSGNKIIKKLAEGDQSVKEVVFGNGELTDENALSLCDALTKGAQEWIERLTLTRISLETRSVVAILRVAQKCPKLQTLEIDYCNIRLTEDMMSSILLTSVKRLSLSGNPVTDIQAARIIAEHTSLRRLFLDSISMNDPILICDPLRKNTSLILLSLTHNNLQTVFIESLSSVIFDGNCTLQTIHLEGNQDLRGSLEPVEIALNNNRKKARQAKTAGEPELDVERQNEQLKFNIQIHEKDKKDAEKLVSNLRKQVAELEEDLLSEADQQTNLKELLERETKECKQLEEDMAASTETFMAKIATLSEKVENQRAFMSLMEKQQREPEPQELVMQMVEEHARLSHNNSFRDGISANNSFATNPTPTLDAPELSSASVQKSSTRKKRATSSAGSKLSPGVKELLAKVENLASSSGSDPSHSQETLISILTSLDENYSTSFTDQFNTFKSESEISLQQLKESSELKLQRDEEIKDLQLEITILKDTSTEVSVVQDDLELLQQTYETTCADHNKEISEIEITFSKKLAKSTETTIGLENSVKEQEEEIKLLSSKASIMEERHDDDVNKINLLENEITDLRGSASADTTTIIERHSAELQSRQEEYKSTIQSHKENISDLQSEIENCNEKIRLLENDGTDLRNQNTSLEENLNKNSENCEKAKHEHSIITQKLLTMEEQLSNSDNGLKNALKEVADGKALVVKLETDIQDRNMTVSTLTERVNELEKSDKTLREESAKLSVTNETLSVSYSAKALELETQISTVVKLNTELELLKKDKTLADTQQELENTTNLLKMRDVEIAELRDAATNLENKMFDGESELRGKLDSLLHDNNKLEEARATLESEMQEVTKSAKAKTDKMQQSLLELEQSLVAATAKSTEQEGMIENLQGKLALQVSSSQDHLASEVDRISKEFDERMKSASTEQSSAVTDVEIKLKTQQESHESSLSDLILQHESAINLLKDNHVTELQQSSENLSTELTTTKSSLNDANTTIEQLKDSHITTTQEMEEAKMQLEVELHTLIQESRSKQSKLEKQKSEKDSEIVSLTQQLAEAEEQSQLSKSETERLRSELDTQESDVSEMRKVRHECDEQMSKLVDKLERQETSHCITIEEWDTKVKELQGRLLTEEAIRRADAEADAYNETQSYIDDDDEPPPEGISKKDWVSSKGVKTCKQCMNKFSLRNRKHHCRRCGGVFCGKCCPSSPLTDNVRVCVSCNSQK